MHWGGDIVINTYHLNPQVVTRLAPVMGLTTPLSLNHGYNYTEPRI